MQAYYFVKIFRICFDKLGITAFITKFIVDYLYRIFVKYFLNP